MIIIAKSGFDDFSGDNIFIAEDGIYFIDTEFGNFSPTRIDFNPLESIKDLVHPDDQEKFMEELNARKADFVKDAELLKAQHSKWSVIAEDPNRKMLCKEGYEIPVSSIL